jgi:DNA-binding MarR family transcriptional regulator
MAAKKSHALQADTLRPADYRLLSDFRHQLREFAAFSENAAREEGLAPQQHQALLAIKGFEGTPTVGDLAERLMIRHHSAVGLVDRLVEARLLMRCHDVDDRRRVTLALTRHAEELLARLSAQHRAELRRVAPMLRALLARIEG